MVLLVGHGEVALAGPPRLLPQPGVFRLGGPNADGLEPQEPTGADPKVSSLGWLGAEPNMGLLMLMPRCGGPRGLLVRRPSVLGSGSSSASSSRALLPRCLLRSSTSPALRFLLEMPSEGLTLDGRWMGAGLEMGCVGVGTMGLSKSRRSDAECCLECDMMVERETGNPGGLPGAPIGGSC